MDLKHVLGIALIFALGTLLLDACAPTIQQEKTVAQKTVGTTSESTAANKSTIDEEKEKVAKAPIIKSISPTKGRQGSKIEIFGERFGSNPVVRFDSVIAKNIYSSDGHIRTFVPIGMSIGKHTVTVEANGHQSNGVEYIDP